MKKESIEFLKELQHEMNTQDKVMQAHPRFWVIMDYKWQMTGVGRGESRIYCFDLCENEAFDVEEIGKELVDYIRRNELEEDDSFYNGWDADLIESDYEVIIDVLDSLGLEYEEINEEFEGFIVPNTMFLTIAEAKKHLKLNYYHYHERAHVYALTAWRSPQVEKLFDILMTEDFEENNIGS